MKTLLFIGVLVAVISWSSALTCWGMKGLLGVCIFSGKEKLDPKCEKVECSGKKPNCGKITIEDKEGRIKTKLSCNSRPSGKCVKEEMKEMKEMKEAMKDMNEEMKEEMKETMQGLKATVCVCDTELCNDPTPKNGADETSYTHLVIAFIVGAIFFH